MSNIETLKNMLAFNRSQPNADTEDVENNLCPHCVWNLDIDAHGNKSCPICGRVYR